MRSLEAQFKTVTLNHVEASANVKNYESILAQIKQEVRHKEAEHNKLKRYTAKFSEQLRTTEKYMVCISCFHLFSFCFSPD